LFFSECTGTTSLRKCWPCGWLFMMTGSSVRVRIRARVTTAALITLPTSPSCDGVSCCRDMSFTTIITACLMVFLAPQLIGSFCRCHRWNPHKARPSHDIFLPTTLLRALVLLVVDHSPVPFPENEILRYPRLCRRCRRAAHYQHAVSCCPTHHVFLCPLPRADIPLNIVY
jgi:hypothetical protein